jgi:hypothetical protein
MNRWIRALGGAGALLLWASGAAAQDEEGFLGYMAGSANQVLVGSQSVLFAPLDPIAETVWPPEELEDLPGVPVTNRVVGAGAGLLLGGYRLLMGLTDLVLCPVPMNPVSPTLRFTLVPDVTQERTGDPEWICDMDGWGEEPETWAHRLGMLACFPWTKGTPEDE